MGGWIGWRLAINIHSIQHSPLISLQPIVSVTVWERDNWTDESILFENRWSCGYQMLLSVMRRTWLCEFFDYPMTLGREKYRFEFSWNSNPNSHKNQLWMEEKKLQKMFVSFRSFIRSSIKSKFVLRRSVFKWFNGNGGNDDGRRDVNWRNASSFELINLFSVVNFPISLRIFLFVSVVVVSFSLSDSTSDWPSLPHAVSSQITTCFSIMFEEGPRANVSQCLDVSHQLCKSLLCAFGT